MWCLAPTINNLPADAESTLPDYDQACSRIEIETVVMPAGNFIR